MVGATERAVLLDGERGDLVDVRAGIDNEGLDIGDVSSGRDRRHRGSWGGERVAADRILLDD
jgi:hypothetical protein